MTDDTMHLMAELEQVVTAFHDAGLGTDDEDYRMDQRSAAMLPLDAVVQRIIERPVETVGDLRLLARAVLCSWHSGLDMFAPGIKKALQAAAVLPDRLDEEEIGDLGFRGGLGD